VVASPTPTICLRNGDFALIGAVGSVAGWCDFTLVTKDATIESIGGHSWPAFAEDMLSILGKESGRALRTISGAAFAGAIGDDDAEYLGNVPLSGYNTFYFFRDSSARVHVVVADADGKLLVHTLCSAQVISEWKCRLEALLS